MGEGFRELTDEEKLAQAPKSPFGSPHGADHWAAGNMAEVLRGLGDYADAIKHFRTDQSATMPYLAAVHERMRDKNPMLAMKFATQMQKAGLAMAAEPEKKPEGTGGGSILSAPIPPTVTPGPIPPAKPGETDIAIPAPQPGPDQKPGSTPFPVPIPPKPEPQPVPQPTPQPPNPQSIPNSTPKDSSNQTDNDRFERFAKGTFDIEGGYSNDPNDRGGETNHGITKGTLDAYQQKHGGLGNGGRPVAVKDLTKEQAQAIYRKEYYDNRRIGDIDDQRTAEHIFDLGVNHSPGAAGKMVQKAINTVVPGAKLEVDGVVGDKTISAINKATQQQLKAINEAIADEREAYYRGLVQNDPGQSRFLGGWLKRAGKFRQ